MVTTIDVVEFEIGSARYALDIQIAREIVEMIPITRVPRAPAYIAGIINLRGEITNIIDLKTLLGLESRGESEVQKIIVLVSEAANGSNVGIIVDDVNSVIQVPETDIEQIDDAVSNEAYVKGIIKIGEQESSDGKSKSDLIIWIDIQKIMREVVSNADM
ncbi:chemotaxis protein CheW [Methanoculleus sp. FWC-SCC1]|uniref:Chemotaxis protein CheW n=1 Tax=Methanoculleus frigidifontis TaxID=2584085 RepID=A0ABT8M7H4_9EURY|nr:chemotaxis protein CheW [Methanoculleus sp. FWC-SCC1]MDN7023885.1 chemotaxis protein CheW [Methanoculleus sp. FWC-SCC1]